MGEKRGGFGLVRPSFEIPRVALLFIIIMIFPNFKLSLMLALHQHGVVRVDFLPNIWCSCIEGGGRKKDTVVVGIGTLMTK
jgi:hypothetical protein